jgi:anti-anti-sigma factor
MIETGDDKRVEARAISALSPGREKASTSGTTLVPMVDDPGESAFTGQGQRERVSKVLEQLDELVAARDQMAQLVRVIVEIGSDLDLDVKLHRIVHGAMELTRLGDLPVRLVENSATGCQPASRSRYHPHARLDARCHHQSPSRRNHSSAIREDHMMPALLTLDTVRSDDGKLVLIAVGEIDLSNIDAFDQALSTATAEAAGSDETLTVDLSGVEYLDSAAINALFTRADHIRVIAHRLLMTSLNVSGLSELVSVEAAPPRAQG